MWEGAPQEAGTGGFGGWFALESGTKGEKVENRDKKCDTESHFFLDPGCKIIRFWAQCQGCPDFPPFPP